MRIALTAFLSLSFCPLMGNAQPLVIHEWGTFTSFQDESGRAIAGINTDDEPVPDFVHRAANFIQPSNTSGKGIPPNHPDVTIRLETPVLYFHLPPNSSPRSVDLNVSFHGGWLTEYFPDAEAQAPGLTPTIGHLTPDTLGSLTWRNIRVGENNPAPKTSDPVWTSPRNVQCDPISVGSESEKFLFYRGVAHLDSPLRVKQDSPSRSLRIFDEYEISNNNSHPLSSAWLVDVRSDGALAWRRATLPVIPMEFSPTDYNAADSLHRQMSDALTAQGLFRDEAEALLNTWQQSYFKNPGLRLFFLVDPAWTNRVLPLHLSASAQITRVMIGRIELVTPDQREWIHQIESTPAGASDAFAHLGRFRNALLLEEQSRYPSAALSQFLQSQGIQFYSIH